MHTRSWQVVFHLWVSCVSCVSHVRYKSKVFWKRQKSKVICRLTWQLSDVTTTHMSGMSIESGVVRECCVCVCECCICACECCVCACCVCACCVCECVCVCVLTFENVYKRAHMSMVGVYVLIYTLRKRARWYTQKSPLKDHKVPQSALYIYIYTYDMPHLYAWLWALWKTTKCTLWCIWIKCTNLPMIAVYALADALYGEI